MFPFIQSTNSSPKPFPSLPPATPPDELLLDNKNDIEPSLPTPPIEALKPVKASSSRPSSPASELPLDGNTNRKRGSSVSPVSTADSGNNVTSETGLSEMADTLIRHLAEVNISEGVTTSPPKASVDHDLMHGDDTSEEEEDDVVMTMQASVEKQGTGKGEELPDDFDHDRVFKMTNSETGEVYDLRTGMPWGAVSKSQDAESLFNLRGLIPARELLVATARKDESDLSEDGDAASSATTTADSHSTQDRRKSIFARGMHKVNKRMKEKMKASEGDPFLEAAKRGVAYVAPGHEEVGDHVKVSVHSKRWSEWSSLYLVQDISAHQGPIWCLAWSPSGVYLASAGQDACINVWKVIENKEDIPPRWREDGVKSSARNSTRNWNCPVVREMPDLSQKDGEKGDGSDDVKTGAVPWRKWKEHTMDIVDLSWNQNDFLLSASIDRTVRLWHVSSTECLHVFPHADFVTSVDFHPKNDLLFLSGCFDKRLRVWSIPESHVAAWATTPEMITSVCFSPSGNQALAGLFNGQVFFWHTDSQGLDGASEVDSPNTPNSQGSGSDTKQGEGGGTAVAAVAARLMAESHVRLRYYTQVEARNRRGKFQQGRKVTGLSWLPAQALRTQEQRGKFAPAPTEAAAEATDRDKDKPAKVIASAKSISGQLLPQQLLVTTNDSRVRLFQMETFSQLCKFKGLVNENMQIRSSFSCDGKYVVSGSENGHVHIWNTINNMESAQEGEHLQAVS